MPMLPEADASEPAQLELPLCLSLGEGVFRPKKTIAKANAVKMPAKIAK